MSAAAFYRALGDGRYQPLVPATGSWNRSHQNGVAIAGLLATVIEEAPTRAPMRVTRLSLDILRPVPFTEVAVRTHVLRDGARLQFLSAELLAGADVVARMNGVRMRLDTSPGAMGLPLNHPLPEDAPERPVTSVLGKGHPMETRLVSGNSSAVGPGAVWVTFNATVVEGVAMSPEVAAAMASDIGSAPSSIVERGAWSFANLDLSVHFARRPAGDWTLLDAVTVSEGLGFAQVHTTLSDRHGAFGRAHQTLFHAPLQRAS